MRKVLLIPFLLLLTGCTLGNPDNKNNNLTQDPEVDLTPSIFNTNMIHYLGRNKVKDSGVTFAMTCSGFEIKVNVTNSKNKILAGLNTYAEQGGPQQFANVFVDGVEPSERLGLPNGTATYALTEDLSVGTHYIRFVKLNEGAFTYITLKSLDFQGVEWIRWDKKYEKKIEFMGDSITCGYGTESIQTDPYSLVGQNGCHTYAYTCASDLDYEPSFCSQSGISIYMDAWESKTHFEDIYKTYDCKNSFDLSTWKIDVAVIALGTNDNTKFNTLTPTQQNTEIENIFAKYKELSNKIKDVNPDCQIFFVYNIMLTQNGLIDTAIKGTCLYLNNTYGEGTAYRYEFMPNNQGGGGHPNATAQIADGHILSDFILDPYDIDE